MWMEDPEWQGIIHQSLLEIANNASDLEHEALREGIVRQWMGSENEFAARIGQALLLRSYIIQGYPVDLPGHCFNVIALDNSQVARRGFQNISSGK